LFIRLIENPGSSNAAMLLIDPLSQEGFNQRLTRDVALDGLLAQLMEHEFWQA
jgi:hypothetical protein